MYRPEGYQEILARTMGAIAPIDAKLVEAGADAYEEGLKKMGKYNTSGYGTTDFPSARKGWLVFIPKEKE